MVRSLTFLRTLAFFAGLALATARPANACGDYCDPWAGLYSTGGYALLDVSVDIYNALDYSGGGWSGGGGYDNWGGGCTSFVDPCGGAYGDLSLWGAGMGGYGMGGNGMANPYDLYGGMSGLGGDCFTTGTCFPPMAGLPGTMPGMTPGYPPSTIPNPYYTPPSQPPSVIPNPYYVPPTQPPFAGVPTPPQLPPWGGCDGIFVPCPGGPVTRPPVPPTTPWVPPSMPPWTGPTTPPGGGPQPPAYTPPQFAPRSQTVPTEPVRYHVPRGGVRTTH